MQLVTLIWSQYFFHSENPRDFKIHANFILPVLNILRAKPAHLFTTRFTEDLKPTTETCCSAKKILFKILVLLDSALSHPRALMKTYDKISIVFMSVTKTSILQFMTKWITSKVKFYYLTNTFHKTHAV